MINVEDFLLQKKVESGSYALVTYKGVTEATLFTKIKDSINGDWFLESPCQLNEVMDTSNYQDVKEYVKTMFETEGDTDEYIKENINHMIIDGKLYDILNFQCSPYMPKNVSGITLITEEECLKHLLDGLSTSIQNQ